MAFFLFFEWWVLVVALGCGDGTAARESTTFGRIHGVESFLLVDDPFTVIFPDADREWELPIEETRCRDGSGFRR